MNLAAPLANAAGTLIWRHWRDRTRLDHLPVECRPATRAEGYAAQTALAAASDQPTIGWKIAATSGAGQQHIGVDGPLAGRLLAQRVVQSGAQVSIAGNAMRVAEAEFVFRLSRSLPQRDAIYTMEEVRASVDALYPGIEIPDSRFTDFAKAGGPQLIADNACTDWFVLGAMVSASWRDADLAAHRVTVSRNGQPVAQGAGAMVLGDPWNALLWIANELREHGPGLRANDLVTTGTCIVPTPIGHGDTIRADFGVFGMVSVELA